MKTRPVVLVLALACALGCSTQGRAAEHKGWVYNGSTGIANGSVEGGDGADFDDDAIASDPTLGYRWGAFGVEAGYAFLGKYEHDDAGLAQTRLKAGGWNVGGNYNHDFDDRWSMQARGGAFFWNGDIEVDFENPAFADLDADDSGTDFYAGASIDYRWSKRSSVGLGYSWYGLDDADVSVWSVHTEFRF